MTDVRTNSEILADQEAFKAAYKRARAAFEKLDGVVGVGFGLKQTGGEFGDEIAITVFVREKKSEEELAPAERIPPTFEGYRTDVRVNGPGAPEVCDNATEYEKIQGGIQIMGRRAKTAENQKSEYQGTLGCIVRKRQNSSRENVYLLTNKHVLYSPGFGAKQTVYHPTTSGEDLGPVEPGALYANVAWPPNVPAAEQDHYFVDCAIARINLDSKCLGSTCTKDTTEIAETLVVDLQVNGVNSLADVRSVLDDLGMIGQKVFKVGRTTGRTEGRVVEVRSFDLNAAPPPDKPGDPRIVGLNTLEIEFDVTSTANGLNCKGEARFTDDGDSGSIIVDGQNRVIGLHSHRGSAHDVSGLITSHACHILPVLDGLGICIPVTVGTSHGSSLATDGSGLLPAIPENPEGDFPIPDGEIVFAEAVLPEPVPVSADEERHMRALLDALRTTRKGRELHDFFRRLRREIGYLIRNSRPVKLVWHRNKGPAFLNHVLNHLKGHTGHVPREIDGISSLQLLMNMGVVLREHGSIPLREAIEEQGDGILEMIAARDCTSVQDCIAHLQEKEAAA